MVRWEYTSLFYDPETAPPWPLLNEYGLNGWELVNATAVRRLGRDKVMFVLKRPLSSSVLESSYTAPYPPA